MKILIVYAGKTGTTEACAERLAAELSGTELTLCNADRDLIPPIRDFDVIAVGSSVRYGGLRPSIRNFLKREESALLQKPLALFLCCGMPPAFEEYEKNFFSEAVRNHAFTIENFGGTLRPKTVGLFDRIVLHFARKYVESSEIEDGEFTPTLPGILPENISKCAAAIRNQA